MLICSFQTAGICTHISLILPFFFNTSKRKWNHHHNTKKSIQGAAAMLLINSLNFNTFLLRVWICGEDEQWLCNWVYFVSHLKNYLRIYEAKGGGHILFYSNYNPLWASRIRENVLCRYIKDRHEGHLWTVIQAGIRRSVSRLLKISPEPPKEKKMKEKKLWACEVCWS